MNRQYLIDTIHDIGLPRRDLVIVGSSPATLLNPEFRAPHDIDGVVSAQAFDRLSHDPGWTYTPGNNYWEDRLSRGRIELFRSWRMNTPQVTRSAHDTSLYRPIKKLLPHTELFDGFRIANLKFVRDCKARLWRAKDRADLSVIQASLC